MVEHGKKLAEDHVDWFLNIIRPLLIEHFVHGFKHGAEYPEEPSPEENESACGIGDCILERGHAGTHQNADGVCWIK